MKLLAVLAVDWTKRAGTSLPIFLLLGLVAGCLRAESEAPANHPSAASLSGSLVSVGSDTLSAVMALWAEDFGRSHPGVDIHMQSSGSFTAPPALTDGVANLAPMSRRMNAAEIDAFVGRRGYRPTPVRVALDAVLVLVHRDNPIRGMTLAQVDAVFSVSRKCAASAEVTRWGQLGLMGEWRARPLRLFGRSAVSGTREYFRERALCGGEFKNSVFPQSNSEALVRAVGDSLNAIGYAGLAHRIPEVKPVPLAVAPGTPFIAPSAANALAGTYPLARYLYIYVAKPPGKPLPAPVAAFIRSVLSVRGQERVAQAGSIPLPESHLSQELARLQ